MKKNIVIILLSIVILGLGGYLVYDKVLSSENKEEENNEEQLADSIKREDYEVVGSAFSGIKSYGWPTDVIGQTPTDPKNVVSKIEIPKILIETDVTKIINDEIYESFKNVIEAIKTTDSNETSRFEQEIDYNYNIKDGILFIMIESSSGSVRGGGSTEYYSYYYDIENDKQLTLNEIINKFYISNEISKENIEKIEAVMPGMANSIEIYYEFFSGIDNQTIYYSYSE